MKECNCRVCTNHRRWVAAIPLITTEAEAAFNEIMMNLEHAETQATYWEMKFKGTWPGDQP